MVPTITVFVKHSADCKDRFEGGSWRAAVDAANIYAGFTTANSTAKR